MAYAPSYGRPPPRQQRPRGPPPTSRGPRQQQNPGHYNNNSANYNYDNQAYQQDWQQNNYAGYQDQGEGYQDYAAANPYYEDQPQSHNDPYGAQYSSREPNGYGYPEQHNGGYGQHYDQGYNRGYDQGYDQSYDQGYQQPYAQQGYGAGYGTYAEERGARPPPRERQQRPPPSQNNPSRGPPPPQNYSSRGPPPQAQHYSSPRPPAQPQNFSAPGPPPQSHSYTAPGPPPPQSHSYSAPGPPPQPHSYSASGPSPQPHSYSASGPSPQPHSYSDPSPPPPQSYAARGPPPNRIDQPPAPNMRQQPLPQSPPPNPEPPQAKNAYGPKPPNEPAPRRSPPRHQDHSAFQVASPTEMAWDNPFPKWPTKRDNSREPPSARASQEHSRYSSEANRQDQQSHSARPSQEQNFSNGYGTHQGQQSGQQLPPSDSQGRYNNGPQQWDRDRKPPNFSRNHEPTSDGRPGTATGARTVPHKLEIPQQSQTQPATPVGHDFSQAYSSPHRSQSPPQQAPHLQPGYDRNINSAFDPPRPGTAPASGQSAPNTGNPPSNVRSASPEEMPAFGNSSNGAEHDPLHTTTPVESSGSQSKYTAYSPQAASQRQHGSGPPEAPAPAPVDQDRVPHSAGPWTSRDRPPAQFPDTYGQAYSQTAPPLRRSVTSDDQTWERGPGPGPSQGPPPGQMPPGDSRGASLDGRPPPASNRPTNNLPGELPYGRPRPQGPPRPNQGGPDPRAGPGPRPGGPPGPPCPPGSSGPRGMNRPEGPPAPRGPGPRPNPQMYPPRTASANPRAEGTTSAPPDQQPSKPPETQERSQDPDALPHHPTPIRPGLMPGGPQNKGKPPPVRQHSGADQTGGSSGKKKKRKSAPVTQEELSRLRAEVSKRPDDDELRFTLAKKLAEASIVLADDGGRADARMKAHNQQRFGGEAREIMKKLVARNHADAMFFLADCHSEGKFGAAQDPKEAFNLYQSAAKLGHAASAYRTAVCCEIGPDEGGGTVKDTQKALQWYKRASSLGDIPATFKCGIIMLKGLMGQPKNLNEAIMYLKKAADRADEENPHALHELGLLYENPNHPQLRDDGYALDCFTRAANLGYRFSQFKLGQVYEYGLFGCQTDPRQSIVNYTKAAAQGEHEAELALSGWYLTGSEGILEHNDTEAYLWARKAATADPPVPKAMFAMGYFTEVGIGCPRSLEEAKKWYGRSASSNFPKAQQRLDELRRGGSSAQKQRERLSRSNQKQHEENCTVM